MSMFKKAERKQLKARVAIDGPSGSGKTYTALRAVCAPGRNVAVIDTEHGSASLYKGESPDGFPWDFDVCELNQYAPKNYEAAIKDAGRSGYDYLIIDSLSHSWIGNGGALDMIDNSGEKNSYFAWGKVTPLMRSLIDAILSCPCHVFATLRTKTAYEIEKDDKGRNVPRKIGTKPEFREGLEYEFTMVGDMTIDHTITFTKSRCSSLSGVSKRNPDPTFWNPLWAWLDSGITVTRASVEQLALIESLLQSKGITNGVVGQKLKATYGKNELIELTDSEASDLINRLQPHEQQKQ